MDSAESIQTGSVLSSSLIAEKIIPDEENLYRVSKIGILLRNYPEILLNFISGFGVNKKWTPFQINKVALALFDELGIIIPVSVGKDPIISPTQPMLHRLYEERILAESPDHIYHSTSALRPIDLSQYEEDLDFLFNELKDLATDNFPYLRDSNRIKNKLEEIGDPKLGKSRSIIREKGNILAAMMDKKYFARYDSDRFDYCHPAIIRDLGKLQEIDDLDSLFDLFEKSTKSKNYLYHSAISTKYLEKRAQTIFRQREKLFDLSIKFKKDLIDGTLGIELRETFRKNRHELSRHARIDRGVEVIDKNKTYSIIYKPNKISIYKKVKNSKMSFPPTSAMKDGKMPFAVNYYYLEFLRNEDDNKPLIFEIDNEKFILALGKIAKKSVHPSWVEICIFNVNQKKDREIQEITSRLEQFMVGVIAGRFQLPPEWMENILRGKRYLKYWLYPLDEKTTLECIGKYGCKVFLAVSCEIKNYLNFPMKEEDICLNLKRFIDQSICSLLDPEIPLKIRDHGEFRRLIQEIIPYKDMNKMELSVLVVTTE